MDIGIISLVGWIVVELMFSLVGLILEYVVVRSVGRTPQSDSQDRMTYELCKWSDSERDWFVRLRGPTELQGTPTMWQKECPIF
jgi:hypothetical protein